MTRENLTTEPFPTKAFIRATLINMIWVNVSEVFRYFAFIMDLMREAFPQITDIAPMSIGVFAIWGIWDTVIVLSISGFSCLFLERFGYELRNAFIAGTLFWISVFVILWLGLFNMNLATIEILFVALPLAWLEMVVAAIVVHYCLKPTKLKQTIEL